jgi:hypothetical protein
MLIDVYHYTIDDTPIVQDKKTEAEDGAPIEPKKYTSYEFAHIHEWYIPEEALKREPTHSYASDTVFPLKKAMFDGIAVYVPNKLEDYLLEKYARSEQSKLKSKEERLKELEPCRVWNATTSKYEVVPGHPYFKQSAFNY